jgi:hypothetical protein
VTVLEASPDGDKLVLGGERDGRLVAAIAFNAPRRLMFYRGRLAAMPPFEDVVAEVRADEKALGDPSASEAASAAMTSAPREAGSALREAGVV